MHTQQTHHEQTLYALHFISGPLAGKVIAVDHFPYVMGRSSETSLLLPDERASRKHAQLVLEEDAVWLEDLGSKNGTLLNGQATQRIQVNHLDEIQIGFSIFKFEVERVAPREVFTPQAKDLTLPKQRVPARQAPEASNVCLDILALRSKNSLAETLAQQILDHLRNAFPEIEFLQVECVRAPLWRKATSRGDGRHAKTKEIPTLDAGGLKAYVQVNSSCFVLPHPNLNQDHPYRILVELNGAPLPANLDRLMSHLTAALLKLENHYLQQESQEIQKQWGKVERYLSAELTHLIQNERIDITETDLAVKDVYGSILFSDIIGFTSLSEKLSPSDIAELLNMYFNEMIKVIHAHGGFINKFIGDALMVLFGVPQRSKDHALKATQCGLDMLASLENLWLKLPASKHFGMRIGINTGNFVAGNIGAYDRMEYTVIGDAVNIASRLEGVCAPNALTVSEETAGQLPPEYARKPLHHLELKGKKAPVKAYQIERPPPR